MSDMHGQGGRGMTWLFDNVLVPLFVGPIWLARECWRSKVRRD